MDAIEPCPLCKSAEGVRPKLVLIDEAWTDPPGVEARAKYAADLRVDDVEREFVKDDPLQQFVDGFFCEDCGKAFVSEDRLREGHRRYK
jgi:hypothetical protein